jgi:glycosyltransferase involved in cell wall biosynthesis
MKVSIITPVYNQGAFIQETIESVLGQDYPDIEYIVIDDGSKDETPKVISRYADRLTHIRHDNIGESRTVNKGYRMTTGDIVGVVNSDDPLFTSDAVSQIVACFKANPQALAVYPDWASIDESGKVLEEQRLPQYTIESMLTKFSVWLGPGMFIKRDVLAALGYRNESVRYTGDLDLSFRIALEGSLAHLPHVVATHRVHAAAASSAATGERMAGELVEMAVRALDSDRLPPALRRRRIEILALANWVAASHCGSDEEARAKFLRKARLLRLLVLPLRVKAGLARTLRATSC